MVERFEQGLTYDSNESAENFRAVDQEQNQEQTIFTPEQQQEIETKRRILSSLAYFIGKDFQIPVELNEPGAGWHWDFQKNIIRIDPKDLLEKPMDYLRFVISHEGGHRRISRTEFIPAETWRQPGFSFMTNTIEDPRDNNFVAENYPKFREQMQLAYEMNLDLESKSKEKAQTKLGYQPRFMLAGFEYIKQWFLDHVDGYQITEDLPDDVKQVVNDTLQSARSSWTTYPSRGGADGKESEIAADGRTVSGEDLISEYAKASYQINLERIWPEFQKLVEKDMEDQRTQELLDEMQQGQPEGGSQGLPQELSDQLTPEEQEELEKAIDEAIEKAKQEQEQKDQNGEPSKGQSGEPEEATGEEVGEPSEQAGQKGKPIDLNSLSPELRQKIKEYIDSLSDDKKKELAGKAERSISDFEKELDEELGGKLSEDPEKKKEREKRSESGEDKIEQSAEGQDWRDQEREAEKESLERRKRMEAILEKKDKNPYDQELEKVSDLIDNLTADLRDVFVKRKVEKYESGYRSGRRWNIRKRIQEKIANIPLLKTEAREQRESESEEMDYAITLMIDLSGSMRNGGKIQEAFKSAIVLAETLNNLGIKFEIVGFQDILLEFKSFADQLDESMREKLNQLILEVNGSNPDGHNNPGDNDDGVCLLQASDHLADQISRNKFLIVISDGIPETSGKSRDQLDKELKDAVATISANTNQKLIGLGLNSSAVSQYYENNLAGISTEEMAETLGGLLREIIEIS